MLPIERGTSPIFGRNDSIDCSEVAFAERVVFRAKETSTPSVMPFGIGPIAHDAPVYERRYPFRPIPSIQQQSIAVVWSVVDDETCESDWGVLFVASVFTLEDPPAGVTEGSARPGLPTKYFRPSLRLLDLILRHQHSDLMLDGHRRWKTELTSKPKRVHWGT
jgi:hypothetical protein